MSEAIASPETRTKRQSSWRSDTSRSGTSPTPSRRRRMIAELWTEGGSQILQPPQEMRAIAASPGIGLAATLEARGHAELEARAARPTSTGSAPRGSASGGATTPSDSATSSSSTGRRVAGRRGGRRSGSRPRPRRGRPDRARLRVHRELARSRSTRGWATSSTRLPRSSSSDGRRLRAVMSWPGDERRHADLNVFFVPVPTDQP